MPLDAHGRPKTVLLLGGNSGIGQAVVRRLISGGATTVLLAGRTPAPGPEGSTAAIHHLPFDAAETATHLGFFQDVFARYGPIDTVIVAFGVLHTPEEVGERPEAAVEMAEVNYVGAVSALLHTAAHMRRQGSGQIVVLSSVAGAKPRANYAYGSTKAGLDFFARGLAADLAGTAVQLVIVRPGFVRTAMTEGMDPAIFAVDVERVADAVIEGLSRNRQVVWVPPVLKWVMAAVKALPPSIARRLG